jgi:hypothetical protein
LLTDKKARQTDRSTKQQRREGQVDGLTNVQLNTYKPTERLFGFCVHEVRASNSVLSYAVDTGPLTLPHLQKFFVLSLKLCFPSFGALESISMTTGAC